MIVSKRNIDTSLFTLKINNLSIERSDCIQYLGVLLDDKLSWKYHIQKLHKKLSKICWLIFKLRQYVPLSTRKLIYYSMFQSTLSYSLINWGRATRPVYINRKFYKIDLQEQLYFYQKQLLLICGILNFKF